MTNGDDRRNQLPESRLKVGIDSVQRDIRHAVRTVARTPGFTLAVVLILALGIGANTAVFSFIEALVLRPLPVRDPEALVLVSWTSEGRPEVGYSGGFAFYPDGGGFTGVSLPFGAIDLVASEESVFAGAFGFSSFGETFLSLDIDGQVVLTSGEYVSGGFFSGIGVQPAAGRLIDAMDDRAGAQPTAVISFRLWQRRFGGNPDAVGASVLVNGEPVTVVGVTPDDFYSPDLNHRGSGPDVYLPMSTAASLSADVFPGSSLYTDNNYYWVTVMGRLRPGVSIEQAQASLELKFRQFFLEAAINEEQRTNPLNLRVHDGSRGTIGLRLVYAETLYVLMAVVGLLLVLACVNVAHLLAARTAKRRHEIAVKLSLGAGPARVASLLLTESLLLALLGGALGIAFAVGGIQVLNSMLAGGQTDFTLHAELNLRVLGTTLIVSGVTGLLFGMAPVIQMTRLDPLGFLKEGGVGVPSVRFGVGRIRIRLSQIPLLSQIAVSILLLVCGGLFVRTLLNLRALSLGFNPEQVLLVSVNAGAAGVDESNLPTLYADLQTMLETIPGIEEVSMAPFGILSGAFRPVNFEIPTRPDLQVPITMGMPVGHSFASTMQIRMLFGREIDSRDTIQARPVAVVNEAFAEAYFGAANAVGQRFRHLTFGGRTVDTEIIGISSNVRVNSLQRDIEPMVFFPYTQDSFAGTMVYHVRMSGDPAGTANAVRMIVRRLNPRIPLPVIRTMDEQMDIALSQERMFAFLCMVFALLGLAITSAGLCGSMLYRVANKVKEIGIRMALGARRQDVIWFVLGDALVLFIVGAGIGLGCAFVTSRFVQSFLYGVPPNDPLTMALATTLSLASILAAGYLPARRAARIEPTVALRGE